MNHQVQVMEIDVSATPQALPKAVDGFAVAADTVDEARNLAVQRLTDEGRVVRSMSILKGGGIAAVVSPRPVAMPPKPVKQRSVRGAR